MGGRETSYLQLWYLPYEAIILSTWDSTSIAGKKKEERGEKKQQQQTTHHHITTRQRYQYHFVWNQSYKASPILEEGSDLQLIPHLSSADNQVMTYHAILLMILQYSLDCLGVLSGTSNRISKSLLPKFYTRFKPYLCIHKEDALVKPLEKEAPLYWTARTGASHWRVGRQKALREVSLT